jgi:hypothetical protein
MNLKSASIALSFLLIACPAPQDEGLGGPGPGNAGNDPGLPGGPNGGPLPPGAPEAPMEQQEGQPLVDGELPPPPEEGEDGEKLDLPPPVRGHVEGFSGPGSANPEGREAGDMVLMQPIENQTSIRGAAHFVLKGNVEGDCSGALRIDVLSMTPASAEAGQVGPLSALMMDAVGPFEVAVPEGQKVELSALCDVDGDDRIGAGDRLSAPGGAIDLSGNQTGISLVLEPMSGVPSPEEGGQERE